MVFDNASVVVVWRHASWHRVIRYDVASWRHRVTWRDWRHGNGDVIRTCVGRTSAVLVRHWRTSAALVRHQNVDAYQCVPMQSMTYQDRTGSSSKCGQVPVLHWFAQCDAGTRFCTFTNLYRTGSPGNRPYFDDEPVRYQDCTGTHWYELVRVHILMTSVALVRQWSTTTALVRPTDVLMTSPLLGNRSNDASHVTWPYDVMTSWRNVITHDTTSWRMMPHQHHRSVVENHILYYYAYARVKKLVMQLRGLVLWTIR